MNYIDVTLNPDLEADITEERYDIIESMAGVYIAWAINAT